MTARMSLLRSHCVRTSRARLPRIVAALAIASAALLASSPLHAQDNAVAGVVRAFGTNEPLAGAQVTVNGGTQRAATDDQGRFRLTGLSGTSVSIDVRRIGYRTQQVSARVGQTDVVVALMANPTSLETVVVTGTTGAQQRREIGNSVATVNAADVVAQAPIVSMQGLLNGRAPGVVIMPASGNVGSGSQVRVRGNASFSLGNNPLLYVDGVRVNNAAATGPAVQSFGSSEISRLNDINPEDIESIEVLKGPSAATLYGTEASNGVINVITKKGRATPARWSATIRQGVNSFPNWKSAFAKNYGINPNTKQLDSISLDSLIAGNQGVDLFKNGRQQETELSVSGGAGTINYYASGGYIDSKGVEPNNSLQKYNGRVNLTITPSSKFSIATSVGYLTGPTNLAVEAGFGGRVFTTLLATPANYNDPKRHGFHSMLPYQYDQIYHAWQDLDRITGSVTLNHTPAAWFQQHLTVGGDRTAEGNNFYYPRIDSLVYTAGSDALGYREITQNTTDFQSIDYGANATYSFRPTMKFTTSAGAQYYFNSFATVFSNGSVFPTPGLSVVNATTTSKTTAQDYSEDKTLGIFAQEQFSWRDRLFLTAALRSDDNSAFGANFSRVTYPKFSLSWVLSEEPWFRIPLLSDHLNSFRIRSAYGEAGKAPTTYSAIRTFSPVSGPGDSPAVTPSVIGNPNLGPERGKEYELGFDADALSTRLGFELTYYHKRTVDAILNQAIAPSIGFSGTQPFNAGAILNSGFEMQLRGSPVRSDRLGVDMTLNYATNDNKVESLYQGANFVSAGTYLRHQVGFPAFAWFEKKTVSAQLDAKGQAIPSTVMCDNGKGGTTLCAGADGKYGTADDAPLVYLGRSVPPHEGSFTTTVTAMQRWHLYTMLDFKQGGRKLDGNTRVRCTFFGGRCIENFSPIGHDPVRVAEIQSSNNLVDFFISKDDFLKWRELTLSYDVPERWLRVARVGGLSRATVNLSGRNLHTWTNFPGLEPEAMFLSGTRGGNAAWEQTTLPQLRTFLVTFNLGF